MRSSNPAFKEKAFTEAGLGLRGEVMTLDGTAIKTGILGALVVAGAAWPWHQFFAGHVSTGAMVPYMLVGTIGGLIFALITLFKKQAAPFTAPAYALLEGLALGSISVMYEYRFPGVAIEAIGLTFAILGAMLLGYTTRIIRPTAGFMKAVALATAGIAIYYLVAMGMMIFGLHAPMIWDSGPVGIGFSLLVSVVAAMNLLIDFEFINQNAQRGAPKYMEWYSAFGVMLTLVWLYLEMLRLVSKLRSR